MEQASEIAQLSKKSSICLSITYLIRYFGDALFFSFYQVFILSKGFGEKELGIIQAIIPIVIIFASPIWNIVAKTPNINKRIMQVITIIEGILIITFAHLSTFELFVIIIFLIAIIDTPFYSLMDGYTAIFGKVYQIEYAKIRRFGSIAYIVGCATGAILVKELGYTNTFIISGIFYICTTIAFRFIKPFKENEKKEKAKTSFKLIIKNNRFIIYAISYVLMAGTAGIGTNFYNAYLVNIRGIPEYYCGYIMSYGVIIELITITILTKYGSKIKINVLYFIIAFAYLLKYTSITLNLPSMIIIISAGFHGLAVGAVIYIHLKFLIELIGSQHLTSGILFISIILSVFTGVGNILVGYYAEKIGYYLPYLILSIIGIIALILFILLFKKEKNNEKKLSM